MPVWAGLGGNGRWSVQEDTWWREPVPGTEGLDDATLGAILFGDDEDVAGTAESAPGRRLDPASLTFATDLLQDPAPGRRSRGAGVLCTSYEVARATGRRVPPAVLETLLEALRTETDPEPTVIATLRHLLDEPTPGVRDWATFAFATMTDTAEVAATGHPDLLDRLLELAVTEPRAVTRHQAIAALATRGDRRVAPVLTAERLLELREDDAAEIDASLLDEAASLLAEPAAD